MQKLGIFFIGILVLFTSCSDSSPSAPNTDTIGTTFETTGSFTSANKHSFLYTFPKDFIPYESDAILTYILWEDEDGGDDYWRPVPQTFYFDDGRILTYNFDFRSNIGTNSIYDIEFFMDGNMSQEQLELLESSFRDNQTFKIVVAPSDFLRTNAIDTNDINALLQSKDIQFEDYK